MKDLIGRTLGGYQILEQLGKGGMAVVYKAYQPSLDRQVAVKVLPEYLTHEPDFEKRFLREAKAVAKLEHPNILAVYDTGQEDDVHYIAMRYVEAGTLKQLMGKPLPLEQVVRIVRYLGDALDHAHEHGVVHRDIKPSNVLVDADDWVLLTDFGVARMMESTEQLTASGVGIGTPAYMSPEQGQGGKIDQRSDVYSLGVMLFEMLTARLPYEADTPLAIVMKHIQDPLPMVRELNPRLPERVEQVILKAMAKAPEDRFQSAGELAGALRAAADGVAGTAAAEGASEAASAEPAAKTAAEQQETLLEAEPRPARKFPIWVVAPIALAAVAAIVIFAGRSLADDDIQPTPIRQTAAAGLGADEATAAAPEPTQVESTATQVESDEFSFIDDFAGSSGLNTSAWELPPSERCEVTQDNGQVRVDTRIAGTETECTLTSLAMELEPAMQVGSVRARLRLASTAATGGVEQMIRLTGQDRAGDDWVALCGLWVSDGKAQALFNLYSGSQIFATEAREVEFNTWYRLQLTSVPFGESGADFNCLLEGASIGRTTTPADAGLDVSSFLIQLHAYRNTASTAVSYVDDVEITVVDQ